MAGDVSLDLAHQIQSEHAGKKAAVRQERDRLKRSQTFGDNLSGLYGNAALSETGPHELAPLFETPDHLEAVPLGRDPSDPSRGLVWSLAQLQGHGITCGATRSGKGVQSLIPSLLTYAAGSTLTIDPKAENCWVAAPAIRAAGKRLVICDPWDEVNRRYGSKVGVHEETTRFNPLSAIDPTSDDFADDCLAIADAIVISNASKDSHWNDSARELISGLTALEIERNPGKASLRDVRRLVTSDDAVLVEKINEAIAARPDSLAARKLTRFTKETDEIASIRSTAATQSAFLDSNKLLDSMATDEPAFDLSELATGRVALFLVLPLDRLKTHGRWLRLILTLAIRTIAKQDTPPASPVLFLLDEFGTIGSLSMVEQAFGLMAGIGIRIWAFLQDLNQLRRDYPDSWETFISNASVIQALRVADLTTSKYLSELLGTTTRERLAFDTMTLRSDRGFLNTTRGDPSAQTAADSLHSRAVMLPQEVRDIPGHKVLNILPGVGNYLLDRMPYYTEPGWADRFRPIPNLKTRQPFHPPQAPPAMPAMRGTSTAAPRPRSSTQPQPSHVAARIVMEGVEWFSGLTTPAKAGVVGLPIAAAYLLHLIV